MAVYLSKMAATMVGPSGVEVPFTSSLSVYAKVLAHNLNYIRN